jgi:hypothetical protein
MLSDAGIFAASSFTPWFGLIFGGLVGNEGSIILSDAQRRKSQQLSQSNSAKRGKEIIGHLRHLLQRCCRVTREGSMVDGQG